MALVKQPDSGVAYLQHKLVLPQNQTVDFDDTRVTLIDAELRDDVYGNGTGLHTFQTSEPAFLEAVKQAMSDANPILEFRLGFGGASGVYWLPWQQHLITNLVAKFSGIGTSAGHTLVIASANSLARMARVNKVKARKGKISDIVAEIATENGLASVVEPTDGTFMLYPSYVSDTRFIKERLRKRAITPKGRAGFFFFVKDNVLHFHTPDYQSTASSIEYYQSNGTSLDVADVSQLPELWDTGIAGSRVIQHDPITGVTKEIDSDPEQALRLAETIYAYSNVAGGVRNIPYHASANPPVESSAIAQYAYQQARQRAFKCTASFDKTITIRHGDLLNIGLIQQAARSSNFSGYYYVTSSLFIVKKGLVNTTYTLDRGELRGQVQATSVSATNLQLVPASQAPGVDPNITAVQSSQLTKGADSYTAGNYFSTVLNADTGATA